MGLGWVGLCWVGWKWKWSRWRRGEGGRAGRGVVGLRGGVGWERKRKGVKGSAWIDENVYRACVGIDLL